VELGFTHLLVNEFEMIRILEMHRPPALARDADLARLLTELHEPAGINPRRLEIVRETLTKEYWGHTEFALDPLASEERQAYREFLDTLRARSMTIATTWIGTPEIWLAPLVLSGESM
jgi:hypothetical protein